MPNIKSAKKRVLISKANYEKNKAYRSALRTAVKKADAAIDAKSDDMAKASMARLYEIFYKTAYDPTSGGPEFTTYYSPSNPRIVGDLSFYNTSST